MNKRQRTTQHVHQVSQSSPIPTTEPASTAQEIFFTPATRRTSAAEQLPLTPGRNETHNRPTTRHHAAAYEFPPAWQRNHPRVWKKLWLPKLPEQQWTALMDSVTQVGQGAVVALDRSETWQDEHFCLYSSDLLSSEILISLIRRRRSAS